MVKADQFHNSTRQLGFLQPLRSRAFLCLLHFFPKVSQIYRRNIKQDISIAAAYTIQYRLPIVPSLIPTGRDIYRSSNMTQSIQTSASSGSNAGQSGYLTWQEYDSSSSSKSSRPVTPSGTETPDERDSWHSVCVVLLFLLSPLCVCYDSLHMNKHW